MENRKPIEYMHGVQNASHIPIKISKVIFFRNLVFKLMEFGFVASIGACKDLVCLQHPKHDRSYIQMSDNNIWVHIMHKQSDKVNKKITEFNSDVFKNTVDIICERLKINRDGNQTEPTYTLTATTLI